MKNPSGQFLNVIREIISNTIVTSLYISSILVLNFLLRSALGENARILGVAVRFYILILVAFAILVYLINFLRLLFKKNEDSISAVKGTTDDKQSDTSSYNARARLAVVELLAEYKSKRNLISAILLLGSALVYISLSNRLGYEVSTGILSIVCLLLLVLLINHKALDYRIRQGLYGTNEYEARELIHYILRNSDKEIFYDGGGQRQLFRQPEQNFQPDPLLEPSLGEVEG